MGRKHGRPSVIGKRIVREQPSASCSIGLFSSGDSSLFSQNQPTDFLQPSTAHNQQNYPSTSEYNYKSKPKTKRQPTRSVAAIALKRFETSQLKSKIPQSPSSGTSTPTTAEDPFAQFDNYELDIVKVPKGYCAQRTSNHNRPLSPCLVEPETVKKKPGKEQQSKIEYSDILGGIAPLTPSTDDSADHHHVLSNITNSIEKQQHISPEPALPPTTPARFLVPTSTPCVRRSRINAILNSPDVSLISEPAMEASCEDLFGNENETSFAPQQSVVDDEVAKSMRSLQISSSRPNQKSMSILSNSVVPLSLTRSQLFQPENTSLTEILRICQQDTPMQFEDFVCLLKLPVVKIGEGISGEVFRTTVESGGVDKVVVQKVIPVGGGVRVNDEDQKSFAEILPEIYITDALTLLTTSGTGNACPSFVQLLGIHLVQGRYPQALLDAWDVFNETRPSGSENDRPDETLFGVESDTQHYIIFTFEDGGIPLEDYDNLQHPEQAVSILRQLTLALAVAEAALEFEHRDLHWGNVLVLDCPKEAHIIYIVNDKVYAFPTAGVRVCVIDFTFSRMYKEGAALYIDLAEDEDLFSGEGDFQFEVYRMMREALGNNWSVFKPITNVYWLRYVVDKLLNSKVYGPKRTKLRTKGRCKAAVTDILKFNQVLSEAESVLHLLGSAELVSKMYMCTSDDLRELDG